MNSKNKECSFLIITLFLLSLNFYNKFYYLTLILFIITIFTAVINKKKISISANMMFIFLFSIFYTLIYAGYPEVTISDVARNLLYFMGYFSGYLIINKTNNDDEYIYHKYLFMMVSGSCVHGILNAVYNVNTYGLNIVVRALPDYWTGNLWTATGQTAMFILMAGYSYYGLFINKSKNSYEKALTVIGLGFAIFYNLYTASRAIFVILIIVHIMSYIMTIFLYNKKTLLKYIIPSFLSSLIIICLYFNNILGIREFVESMPLFDRLASSSQTGLSEDDRMNRWQFVLSNFWDYPFGGLNFRNQISYAHNLWLDAYDVAGIIPFAFLMLFTTGVIKNAILIIRSNQASNDFKILIVGVYLSCLLQFMIEPVLDGAQWLFILFCIFTGMTDRYYKNISSNKRLKKG